MSIAALEARLGAIFNLRCGGVVEGFVDLRGRSTNEGYCCGRCKKGLNSLRQDKIKIEDVFGATKKVPFMCQITSGIERLFTESNL
jgi:hypothetical protein